jgi:hypothetical protein
MGGESNTKRKTKKKHVAIIYEKKKLILGLHQIRKSPIMRLHPFSSSLIILVLTKTLNFPLEKKKQKWCPDLESAQRES